ncbi:hypothetical protein BFINE_55420 [Bacteroides finegoldii DSM 17565]|nr:hypothetical protein BFINE_55420 [Bacteroides finegoldii DSM 17565]
MIKKEEVYKIGLFNKPHGIHGELQFTFTDDIFDRVDCDYLVCLLDGIFVPFFIEEYRFRSDSTALVKLEGSIPPNVPGRLPMSKSISL